MSQQNAAEIKAGDRFAFGANWEKFLEGIGDKTIENAKKSLRFALGCDSLSGQTFLDIGCGSGISSLAAKMLGATVYSFDYDPRSVNCTAELKRRYFSGSSEWIVEQGSVLDRDYLQRLGQFDIVYCLGGASPYRSYVGGVGQRRMSRAQPRPIADRHLQRPGASHEGMEEDQETVQSPPCPTACRG